MDGLKPTHPPGTSTFRAKATASMRGGMRRSPRLPVDLEGALTGRVVHPVRLVDLSLTGCLGGGAALLEPGAMAGLAFVSLAAQDQTRLRRFMEEERRRRRSADAPSD